jgi:hypothetical protein
MALALQVVGTVLGPNPAARVQYFFGQETLLCNPYGCAAMAEGLRPNLAVALPSSRRVRDLKALTPKFSENMREQRLG